MKVKLKKRVARKRITEVVSSGSSLKVTNPNPAREIKAKIKIGSKNLGILYRSYNILVNRFVGRTANKLVS